MKSNTLAWCCFAMCLSTALGAATRGAQETELVDDEPGAYRLPDTVEPVSYELSMMPVVECANKNYTFYGQVDIVIRTRRYTSEVILNAKDLLVSYVSELRDMKSNSRYVAVEEYVYDECHERLVIRLERTILPMRRYRFTVKFEGVLGNDFKGFHKYFYDSADNSRWVALTQFKPVYARRAFPCFDEPKFKTPYTISIARQSQYFSLSNMPLQRSEVDPQTGWIWDHFETTKPIPTYLVALIVSDFDKRTLDNENIAMFTRKEFIEDTIYMMGKAPNLLQGVEKFTQIPYMLPKLDLVGIPLLDACNMENWGLNSYQEFYLTLSNSSDTDDKILGTMTVLHEILHQWFGNMVTSPWWDYTWLNEGICNYLNYYIADTTEVDWDLEEKFLENVHQRALSWDEFDDTHPLTLSVSTPNEIINSLDVLVTDKSAALFRMLYYMVGETNFRMSLNKYLNDHAYAEAGPKELWETFDYVLYDAEYVIDDDVTVNNSMYLWTEQAGFPLITITTQNGSVVATQERFSLSVPRESIDTKWFVGLTYTTEKYIRNFDDVKPTVWLKPDEDYKVIPVPANSGWIIFNLQSTGFYRVNYDEKNWKLLLIQMITKHDEIHELNRAQIIDDAHHLSRAGLVPWDYYISLLEYLLMEDHVTPWNTAVNGLSSITDSIRMYPEEHSKFKEYVKSLADILYRKLTLNQINNEPTKIGWSKLLAWICKSGHSSCEDSALKHFDSWTNGHVIPSEMKEAAFCVGMKHGNSTAWSKMFEFYKSTRSATYKQSALRALVCIENVQTLFNYLNFILSEGANHGSAKNFKILCENVVTTPKGVQVLAAFLLRESNAILATKDSHQFASIAYSALASKVATEEEIVTMNKIRRSFKSVDLKTVLDENYQKMMTNFKWIKRDHKKIIKAICKL